MADNKINEIMDGTLDKIKSVVNVDTVMGSPINTPDGTTIIPVCKINYGFGSGGSDIPSKHTNKAGGGTNSFFGGGVGASVSVDPVAFLVIKDGNVKITQIEPFTSSIDRLVQSAPEFIDKIGSFFVKEDKAEEQE